MGVRFGSAGDRNHLREIFLSESDDGRTGKREEVLERIKSSISITM